MKEKRKNSFEFIYFKKSLTRNQQGFAERKPLRCYKLVTNRGYSKWATQLRKEVKETFYKATKVTAVETHGTLNELFNTLAAYKT